MEPALQPGKQLPDPLGQSRQRRPHPHNPLPRGSLHFLPDQVQGTKRTRPTLNPKIVTEKQKLDTDNGPRNNRLLHVCCSDA